MGSFNDLTGKFQHSPDDFDCETSLSDSYFQQSYDICDDDCDGFCPECEQMIRCEAYDEIKHEWDSFYT
jgi:hypothetical protein